jgi:putative peptide zinc metalloprotease protein
MEMALGSEELSLIPLRRELRLYPAAEEEGRPGWTLEDPVRNRFFRLGRHQVEQLARWECGTGEALCHLMKQEAGIELEVEDVAAFQQFLLTHALLQPGHPSVQNYLENKPGNPYSWWFRALQAYIFFRVPLWRPQTFLKRTLPWVRFLATPTAFLVYAVMFVFALLLLTPQWSSFFDSFSYFISWQGAATYLVALFAVKFMHELGHAYTATAHGIKVPVIGVAVIVLWPMLYSDNTAAWREQNRKVRIKIVLAGISVEIVVAILATFLWSFLQPGLLRSTCFVLATSSWIHSLLINISPFMRFDGYYLFSDILGVPNLAPRAFALGRWRLRRLLWGWDAPRPEYFSPRMERILTIYCYATWVYRVILFTVIALVVYHMFFKALGIFLFVVEIYMFIFRPIMGEMAQWWKQRELIGCNGHVITTLLIFIVLTALLFVPFPTAVVVPAELGAKERQRVFAPFPARVKQIHVQEGQQVRKGELLYTLASPQLESRRKIVALEAEALKVKLERELGLKGRIEVSGVTQNRLAAALVEGRGLDEQRRQLQIRAKIGGRIEQIPVGLEVGTWIGYTHSLCEVVNNPGGKIRGSIAEDDLRVLGSELEGWFYPEAGDLPRIRSKVSFLDSSNQTLLEPKSLASIYGGDVAVVGSGEDELRPAQNRYRIDFAPQDSIVTPTSVRGYVVLKGKRLSLVSRTWKALAPGLIRETGL